MENPINEELALSMLAGARAIETNKWLSRSSYVYDVFEKFGPSKEVSYHEAAKRLREVAEAALGGGAE